MKLTIGHMQYKIYVTKFGFNLGNIFASALHERNDHLYKKSLK
jgi:hypothetical protein